jgi:hypothetical protein
MMNISFKDILLFTHAGVGMLGVLAALWVFVDTLNVRAETEGRIRWAATITALLFVVALVCGGYWYVHFYPAEKAIILKGPWPFAHTLFMETKEHLFFVSLILALYLPIAAAGSLAANAAARRMVLTVSALIVLSALAIEGAGAGISYGVKVAFLKPTTPATP